MSFIVITSLLIRLAAVAWCLRLMRDLADRRFALLAAMLALMAARQAASLAAILPEHSGLALGEFWELPSAVVSVLGLLTAVYLGHYATEAQRHRPRTGNSRRASNVIAAFSNSALTSSSS